MIRLHALAVVCLLAALGCTGNTNGNDLGILEPGCRTPSACYKIGADCPCDRADVNNATCKVCDPLTAVNDTCYCSLGQACTEASLVCVGRAPTTCLGEGARCLPVGGSCATSGGGDPPQLVGTGPGGSLEPRCQYVDDVCCPGVIDMAAPD